MKKAFFLILFFAISLSLSAHPDTKRFQKQSTDYVLTNSSYSSVYITSNGGLIQLIYTMFTKVGEVIYTSTHNQNTNVKQEDILSK